MQILKSLLNVFGVTNIYQRNWNHESYCMTCNAKKRVYFEQTMWLFCHYVCSGRNCQRYIWRVLLQIPVWMLIPEDVLMILLFGAGGEAKVNKPKPVVQREHVDLISKIRSQSRPKKLDVALPSYIPIQHKRKPRSLVLSPAIDHLCATRYIFFHYLWFSPFRECLSRGTVALVWDSHSVAACLRYSLDCCGLEMPRTLI